MKPFPRSGLPGVQPPVGPSETTTSIGRRCKRSDALSRAVLIAREAFPLFQRFSSRCVCSPDPSASALELVASIIAKSLFQRFSREGHTRSHSEHGSQASLRRWYLAPGPGRVGRRWILAPHEVNLVGGFFLYVPFRLAAALPPKGGHAHVSAEALSGQRSLHGRLIPAAYGSRAPA